MAEGRRLPPRVERVRIKNFRALREVEFKQITPLSVLLGPNGSGKSTYFMMKIVAPGSEEDRHDGFPAGASA